MYAFENLLTAFYQARRGKPKTPELCAFEYDLEPNLFVLQAELRAYRAALDELAGALDARDGAALERMFARSRTARQAWETAADRRRDGGEE